MPHRITLPAFAVLVFLAACSSPPPPPDQPAGPEVCDNGKDDNADGKTDCADPLCFDDGACKPAMASEDCLNGLDDDGDSLIDCEDSDCVTSLSCIPPPKEACTGGADEDQDGKIDCLDPDCVSDPACKAQEICNNNQEDNGDVFIDCADPTCGNSAFCPSAEAGHCTDGMDNDGDGAVDCQDADCMSACPSNENTDALCSNGQDDDSDFLSDCDDSSCLLTTPCRNNPESACDDGQDNDGDAKTDCADPDCVLAANCQQATTETDCADNVDNDGDNQTDCKDADCAAASNCQQPTTETSCTDNVDNDNDGDTDCADSDCAGTASCPTVDDGQPCTTDAQCKGGKCLTEVDKGFPGGFCTNSAPCTVGTTNGCNGGTCMQVGSDTRCYIPCSGATGCRPGYACFDPDQDSSTTNSVCEALCTSDTQCTATGQTNWGCNPWSKFCGNKNQGLGKYGAACTQNSDCESDWCYTGISGGYCVGACNNSAGGCGGDGVCLADSPETDAVGVCYDGCSADTDCRNHYICDGVNTCWCAQSGDDCNSNADCCSGSCTDYFFFKSCD